MDLVAETLPPKEGPNEEPTPARECTPVPVTENVGKFNRPLQYWVVYVDDFLGLAQGNKKRLQMIKRALLHALDSVFHPLEPDDLPDQQDPASVKKLKKGDAT